MPETARATHRGLSLLGGWRLVEDGEIVVLGGREQRLCALLALTGTRARAQVAGTLWPDSTDARALASLRRAVAQTHQRSPGLLAADRTSVGLAPEVATDVDALRDAVSRAGSPDADATLLAALVGEELLPGWYDEWVEAQREVVRQQRVAALEQLSRRALERDDTVLAEDAARAVARIEPLREPSSELVIRALLARGDHAGAVRELERYREVVRAELGVVPSPALFALVEEGATPVVPAPRTGPADGPGRPVARPAESVDSPDDPDPEHVPVSLADFLAGRPSPAPSSPRRPGRRSWRPAAARLALATAVVAAASLAVANLGPDDPRRESSPATTGASDPPAATGARGGGARQVRVRPVVAAGGVAAFVVRATRRPARVRLEVAARSGDSVVRNVVVRSREGQRLVVAGLEGGTYQWSATSPTAAPVTGEVRVDAHDLPLVTADDGPGREPPPPPAPAGPDPTTSTPAPPAPTTASPTPVPTPTQQPPSHQPHEQPSPQQPSPTRHPDPPSQPTDPGTQGPVLVG